VSIQNTTGIAGFTLFVVGLSLYDYRLALVVGGGILLIAAITGMVIHAIAAAGPRE
jgi:hypothetical protein